MKFNLENLKASNLRRQNQQKSHYFIVNPGSYFCRCGASQYDFIHLKNNHWLTLEEISKIYGLA